MTQAANSACVLGLCLLAASLSGCTILRLDSAVDRPDSEVAVLQGSSIERFVFSAKADILSVDGQRMNVSIFVSTVNAVRLLPGRHWIEATSEVHHDLPFGGWNICTCAFEFDFAARHRYRLQANANTYDVPCYKQTRLHRYKGLVSVEVLLQNSVLRTEKIDAVCTGGGLPSFCQNHADCGSSQRARCLREESSPFGLCEQGER